MTTASGERDLAPRAIASIDDGVVVCDGGDTIRVHETVERWTLMAVTDLPKHGATAVFEDLSRPEAELAFVTPKGVVLRLEESLAPTRVPESSCYGGRAKQDVLGAGRDVLREDALSESGDPTFQDVAAMFPPIRRIRHASLEAPHTFVGSRSCDDVIPVYYNPSRATPRVNPLVVAPDIRGALEREDLWEGLVGGWLPVVRIVYPCGDAVWDTMVFAVAEPRSRRVQPAWYRFLRVERGRLTKARYVDSYLPYPHDNDPPAGAFYRALYDAHASWSTAVAGGMEIEVPEHWVANFCKHAMVQEMITRAGDDPRYGVLDRVYGSAEHNGFQDILNSAVSCYLEWGRFDIARRYLDNYFEEFVRPDGSIDYRGPEIGQYARMLTLLAQYAEYTGDDSLLRRHDEKVDAIVRILRSRRDAAKRRDHRSAGHGMLSGRHEADISFDTPSLAFYDYEQPYFSNSTEAWRAFRDLGRKWELMGDARGQPLIDEADTLGRDIARAIDRSWIVRDGIRSLPLIAGSPRLHLDAPYRSRPESYDENRVWSEMLHSGIVSRDVVVALIDAATERGDTTLGIFGNRKLTVGFTVYGLAFALIQHDLVREFLLFWYAHALHLHTRGTWTALECVDMDRDRADHLPYCAPAQMTIPTVTRWMLAFTDPLTDELWLAKATPRAWLEHGKRVRLDGAPTRWGSLSFEVASRVRDGVVFARVSLPERYARRAMLRLRLPDGHSLASVEIGGERWGEFDANRETVTLPGDRGTSLELTVHVR